MIDKLGRAIIEKKQFVVIAIAAMVIFAYAFPYGVGVEAKKGPLPDDFKDQLKNKINNIKAYGHAYGLGLLCDHFKNIGPLRCR
jgi:hypothetical protein